MKENRSDNNKQDGRQEHENRNAVDAMHISYP
jgi:hypothetical protein